MFKSFYIHFSRPVKKNDNSRRRHTPRGFTMFVQPSDKDRHVTVRATFCSPLDQFCKSKGRDYAWKADPEILNTRRLPDLLAACKEACGEESSPEEYLYVLKYVV